MKDSMWKQPFYQKLEIQCNPNQNPYLILHRNRKKNYPKIYIDIQKPWDIQNNPEQKINSRFHARLHMALVIKTI